MGQIMDKFSVPVRSVADILSGGSRKRKRSQDSLQTNGEQSDNEAQMPKKKKLLTTTQYIYQALFKEQQKSDISIMALGKVWRLHIVYLSQSPYFASMFNGSWKEACQDFVHIKILDDRITLDALDAVFGSMYKDEIEIDPKTVTSILATATLFHLDSIIDQCVEVMIENINAETVLNYYEAACQYGCQNVKKSSFVWLQTNLLCIYTKYQNLLRQINVDLMTALVSSPDLYVMQTEFSLYTLLRIWMYLRLHPNYDPDNPHVHHAQQQQEDLQRQKNVKAQTGAGNTTTELCMGVFSSCLALTDSAAAAAAPTSPSMCPFTTSFDYIKSFFTNRHDKCSFLSTPEGKQFLKPYMALRTQYLINHHMDLKVVLADNIIPKSWFHNHALNHWSSVLKVDHMPAEEGPQNLSAEEFNQNCMRYGRILSENSYQKWRWTGFNFGLDLILIVDSRILSVRRHHRNEQERLVSLMTKRQFMIRASVTSINSQRQPIFTQTTEIHSLCLEKNEESVLMIMDPKLVDPVLISISLLVVPPTPMTFKENLLTHNESANAAVPISEIGGNCERATTPPTTSSADDNLANSSENLFSLSSSAPLLSTAPSSPTPSSGSYSSTDFM